MHVSTKITFSTNFLIITASCAGVQHIYSAVLCLITLKEEVSLHAILSFKDLLKYIHE